MADKPRADKPRVDKRRADQPRVDKPGADKPPDNRSWAGVAIYVLIAALFLAYVVQRQPVPSEPRQDISYTRFKDLTRNGQVREVILTGDLVEGLLFEAESIGPEGEAARAFRTRIPQVGDPELLPLLEAKEVSIAVERSDDRSPMLGFLLAVVPWALLLLFLFWVFRRATNLAGRMGGPQELDRFLKRGTPEKEVPDVTFADVAGQENAKREVTELVEFLTNPDKFRRLGAEVPRGVLLMGPPGTGKTLLARALAGEAGVPFFSISGSEFIEVFVGVGAARVRSLFQAAKGSAPSIVFVDELDSVGRTRGTGLGGGHDEREQTLNQILAEMDGFKTHEAVIVLAATNRPDVLDPALLRPGRFDRHVTLDLPDRRDREAILAVHSRGVPLDPDVDLEAVARGTPGFSGADLKNLVNEAAMLAAHGQRQRVTQADFDAAREKLLLGTERSLMLTPEERHRLATHEAGHTLVAHFLRHADPLYKVTIIPRGRALGGTQQLPESEHYTLPEEYLRDRLAVMLGGRAAERLLLGSVSSGADDDIHQATSLARAMVSRWGMSEEIGPVDLRQSEEHPFLGREIAQPRHYSEHSAEAVDEAVEEFLKEAEARASEVIEAHKQRLERLVAALEEHETLEREKIDELLDSGQSDKVVAMPGKPAPQ